MSCPLSVARARCAASTLSNVMIVKERVPSQSQNKMLSTLVLKIGILTIIF